MLRHVILSNNLYNKMTEIKYM